MKWLYIKNGDVVSQLAQLENLSGTQAGPNAFLADLLRGIKDQPALMFSWCTHGSKSLNNNIEAISYQVVRSQFGRIGNAGLRIKATLSAMVEIFKFQPDKIICGRVGPMLWMIVIVSKILSKPFIHSRHNSLYEGQNTGLRKLLTKLDIICIRRAKSVICHGPFLRAQMIEIGFNSDKIFEFDVAFDNFNSSLFSENNTRNILFIGRMARNKGIFDLLQASTELLQSDKSITLTFIGNGPDIEKMTKLVETKNLTDQVFCLGTIKHESLPDFINSSYVVVTPTRREFPEGRCLAAMEALACGIPLIAPDSGPFPYLIKDSVNGHLFETDNVDSLQSTLTRIFNNKEHYQTLKKGAEISSEELKTPIRSFFQAVEMAFDD